mgnify:CR=1 FL=1
MASRIPIEHRDHIIALYRAGQSLGQIATAFGLTPNAIAYHLHSADVRRRPPGPPPVPPTELADCIRRYTAGESLTQIGVAVHRTAGAILYRLRRAGVPRRARSAWRRGPENPHWRGGRAMTRTGYVRLSRDGQRVLEHRVVAERTLGRPLLADEIVHHLNGIRHDNRPDNLTVIRREGHETWTYVRSLQRRIRELEAIIQKSFSQPLQARDPARK